MASDWKQLLQALRDAGYEVEIPGRGNHIRVGKGGKRLVTIPASPGDRRGYQNALSDLRKHAGFHWRPKQVRKPRNPREDDDD